MSEAKDLADHPNVRAMRWEHGVHADEHRVVVCNAMTGHFYRTVALAETPAHAKDIAAALNAMLARARGENPDD